jgi:hypothetical protein
MVRARSLACSSDFLLRLAGCQSKDLVAEARRSALAAAGFAAAVRSRPRDRAGAAAFVPLVGVLAEAVLFAGAPLL